MESQKSNNPERFLLGEREYTIPEGHEAVIEGCKVIVRTKENLEERAKRSILRLIEAFHYVNFPTPEGFSREDLCAWVNSHKTGYAKELALSFIEFLDKNRYEGKMCVSNPECADIDKAFVEKDWAKLMAYANKYLRGAAEGRTVPLSIKCQEWIDAVECVAGAFPPGSKGYDMVIGSIHDLIKYLKSTCQENRLWSEDEKTRMELIEFHKDAIHTLELQERKENEWEIEKHKEFIAYLEKQKEQNPDDIKMEWWNKGYLEGRKNAHIPARELGLPSSWDFQKDQQPAEWSEKDEKDIHEAADYLRDYANNCVQGGNSKLYLQSLADRIESLRPQPKQEWSEEDEKQLNWFYRLLDFIGEEFPSTWGQNHKGGKEWLKARRPQPNNNLRWRRAKDGENLPESIIIHDGDDPRFGKCAVRDSYYIPISELKELPKE